MSENIKVLKLELESTNEAYALLGNADSNVKVLEDALHVSIITRGEAINVTGEPEEALMAQEILKNLLAVVRRGITISTRDVIYAIELAKKGTLEYFVELYKEEIAKTVKGKSIRVKTIGQRHYIQAIKRHDLSFWHRSSWNGKNLSCCCDGH